MSDLTSPHDAVVPLTADEHRRFAVWRGLALLRAPYLAAILFSVTPLSAPGLRTMGVDKGHRLYIDVDEVSGWGDEACSQVLLHEAMHLMGGHAALAESVGVTPQTSALWNYAADAAANDDLRDMGCEFIASTGILPGRLGAADYRTATEYYSGLMSRLGAQQMQQSQQAQSNASGAQAPQGGSSGQPPQGQAGAGTSDQGQAGQRGNSKGGQGQQNQAAPGPGPKCAGGSGAGTPAPWELPLDDDLDGQAPAVQPGMTNHLAREAAQKMVEELTSKGRGTIPGDLAAAAHVDAVSTTAWDQILLRMVSRSLARGASGDDDLDYSRRSRRHHAARVTIDGTPRRYFVPARTSPRVRVAAARDTSGSMSLDDMNVVNAEIQRVLDVVGVADDEIVLADVDTKVQDARRVRARRDLTEVYGRGGTDMCAAIAWADTLRPRPDVMIVLTDGGTSWPETKPRFPVIACIVGEGMTKEQARHSSWGGTVPEWISIVPVDTATLRARRSDRS